MNANTFLVRAAAAAMAAAVAALLAGCASPAGISSQAQVLTGAQVGLPDATETAGAAGAAGASDSATSTAAEIAGWRNFGDPTLDALVQRALAGHPGLRLAQARVARAEALMAGQQARDGLQVNASADLTRQRFSATSIYPPPLGGSIRTLASTQLGASWAFDFFGRNRAALEATLGAQRAAQAELAAAGVALAARVSHQYVQLARLQDRRRLAQRALAQRGELLRLVQQRVQAGVDTTVELRQGEGALPETRTQIEQLDEQITLTRHALAALTAQPPYALDGLETTLQHLNPSALPATLPADLLGRRADIVAARWRIEAAGADVRAARAGFYPDINLTAFVGLSSIGLDRLLRTSSEQYGAGPALRLPIFDSGALRANLRTKTADVDAAVESYNGAVLEAVHEAADQIASVQAVRRQEAEQALAQAAAESAYDLATQRYGAGLSPYLTVLNAETAVLAQRRLAVDLKARRIDAHAALFAALGGDAPMPKSSGDAPISTASGNAPIPLSTAAAPLATFSGPVPR